MTELLNNQERVTDSYVFPARGLTLVGVDYPNEDQLIERSKLAMAKRVDD
jgi:tRNA pseudouridine38-40 synthase